MVFRVIPTERVAEGERDGPIVFYVIISHRDR